MTRLDLLALQVFAIDRDLLDFGISKVQKLMEEESSKYPYNSGMLSMNESLIIEALTTIETFKLKGEESPYGGLTQDIIEQGSIIDKEIKFELQVDQYLEY